jgi:tRNA A22 N-methylase
MERDGADASAYELILISKTSGARQGVETGREIILGELQVRKASTILLQLWKNNTRGQSKG